ncbi:MAG: ABC transporter permease [Micromonosporaceae bacterium]|nr:ABC transporter permease [Micromonosporaceae bacterium]
MTAAVHTPTSEPVRFWSRERKVGLAVTVAGVLAAFGFGALAGDQPASFTLADNTSGAAVSINGLLGAVLFGLLGAAAGAGLWLPGARRWFGALLAAGIVAVVGSFLCWQLSDSALNIMPLGQVAQGSMRFALPLIFGGLAGVLGERSGVINIAIEGQFISGAFAAAMVATLLASVWAGILAAAVGGLVIAALLAVLAIRYLVDQIVVGVVLIVFALGLTGFLFEQLMRQDPSRYNQPARVPTWEVGLLSDIPLLGPVLFRTNIFVYLALALVAAVHFGLFHTRWGLRTRAVGEHPTAADTVGVRVLGMRYRNVLVGGVLAGIGGATFTLEATTNFSKGMTAGLGFIALAAMIFGRWSPVGVLLAALFFGFCRALAIYLGTIGSPIPSQFLNMLPYLATIAAVAGLAGRVRAPAADGKPYVKG